jgi:hypothetical protein
MTNFIWRVLMAVLFLFTACYVSFQVYRMAYTPYETETLYQYTVSDACRGQAVFLRDEQVIASDRQGLLHFIYEDGSRVQEGMAVAEVYTSQEEIDKIKRIEELTREIQSLQSVQNTAQQGYINPDTLADRIAQRLGEIADMAATGVVSDVADSRAALLDLLNRRQLSVGRESDFSQRITYLQNELAYARQGAQGAVGRIEAPATGYFAGSVDGFEQKLGVAGMQDIETDDLRRAIAGQLSGGEAAGAARVVLSHNWYLALAPSPEEAAKYVPGAQVTLDFGRSGLDSVPAVVYQVRQDTQQAERGPIVFVRCNYVTPELISLRRSSVGVLFRTYSGFKVGSAAVRFVDGQKRVYVIQGKQVIFTPILTLYEEENFVLCEPTGDAKRALRLFDQVIVGGTDLYDGKTIL